MKIGCVFCFCSAAWVFFRAESIGDAVYVLTHLFEGIDHPLEYRHNRVGLNKISLLAYLPMIFALFLYDCFDREGDAIEKLSQKSRILQWCIWLAIGLWIILYSQKGVAAEFVYFQF